MITSIAVGLLTVTSAALFAFGLNLLYLTWRATRLRARPRPSIAEGNEQLVCVQLPIYNERYVAERVLDAACALDWPANRLEIQVLDDSDDETVSIVARRVEHWRRSGIHVTHVRRQSRTGFKAGALAHGLTLTDSPFIAIFDADFVPPPDFLRRMMGVFDDPTVGFGQARWGHLDEGYSWFTRLQALAIDFHFLIEQAVRSAEGYFTNFTGTAGVWRRRAIEDSGGWSAATLTEDLDLSYRAQLGGWRAAYVEDLVVPEELPVSIDAYRRQQSRWATGSFQTAFRLLGPVLRSRNRTVVKLQATMHLLAYGVGPVMLVQLVCYPTLLLAFRNHAVRLPWFLADTSLVAIFVGVSPWIGFMVAQTRRGRRWWSGLPSLLCQVVGAGMSFNTLLALLRSTRRGGVFVRTPKHRIEQRGQEWRDQAYVRVGDPRVVLEAMLGIATLAIVPFALAMNLGLVAVYVSLFALGFFTVAALSLVDFLEVLTLRSLGRRALARAQAAAPAVGLLCLGGLLLLLAAQMPEPFEDGYAHWLIAANLTATGQLRDPLFGMEDTWLPGYHLLAAAMLRVFGLWQLGALKALGALLGLLTLAFVYRLAPNGRQGRLAVALLVLNPVFLFTSGSAVAEPFMTALLTGAALAATRGRMKVAALLATLACLTATKAWIWVAAAVAFALLEVLGGRAPARSRLPSVAWAVPAIGVLVFLQLGFAPASHSVARGSLELMSATTRGSVPVGVSSRLSELIGLYGLAALPLFVFGFLGFAAAIRQKPSPLLHFVYVPALAYLIVVVGLVATGTYTGSHRYLYPALPAFALLGAAALDRYAAIAGMVTIGASGLLAIAFLPVFTSFASVNAGLMAAGKAASDSPGQLVTDSPVVAYYSGKEPSNISGSQHLPLDRAQAIDWMRAKGVTAVVLENISYYRASVVFSDLVAGKASPPFESLGVQSDYRVSRGKTVYAYGLGAPRAKQTIYPGLDAVISPVPAEGKTAPLAKGVSLSITGSSIAGEGMGFGVPIVRYPDGWVYARTATTTDFSTPANAIWRRTFQLDEIGGDAPHDYQFVPIASRGSIEVTYLVDRTGISITVKPLWLAPGHSEVGILNEQSAAFDDFAAEGQPTLVGNDFGSWVPATGAWARLRSASLRAEWSVLPIADATLHGGRELIPPPSNWAGLDYMFPASFAGTTYYVTVQEER